MNKLAFPIWLTAASHSDAPTSHSIEYLLSILEPTNVLSTSTPIREKKY